MQPPIRFAIMVFTMVENPDTLTHSASIGVDNCQRNRYSKNLFNSIAPLLFLSIFFEFQKSGFL